MKIPGVGDFDIVRIERVPSELKAPILEALAALDREYRERAQPYIDQLVELEGRYPAKMVLVPKS